MIVSGFVGGIFLIHQHRLNAHVLPPGEGYFQPAGASTASDDVIEIEIAGIGEELAQEWPVPQATCHFASIVLFEGD